MGTYPPRECGIATFTQDLLNYSKKILEPEMACKVAAFNVSPLDHYKYPKEVNWIINQSSKKQHVDLARTINEDDSIKGVILQHEYGIYGGEDGKNILYFMENCKKPILVTLHTVLPRPRLNMKVVTERIIKAASSLIVLTDNSKKILEDTYLTSKGKAYVIPHGVHPTKFNNTKVTKKKLGLTKYTVLATFGLLSRGKGIEYVIKALPAVVKKHKSILYMVLGKTHPAIRKKEGETYRNELMKLVKKLKLNKHVKFYDQYLTLTDLLQYLKATDIYISTSTNPNQAVSGTLSYAMGTGRAVVSTDFAQAKEIITPETGRLVPIKNSNAISDALHQMLGDKYKLAEMHKKAYEITRPMLWSNVSRSYLKILDWNYVPEISLKHLEQMTDDFGLYQFAKGTTPDAKYGYTVDDNVRAMVVYSWLLRMGEKVSDNINVYLRHIRRCQQKDGVFLNYFDCENKLPTTQNYKENLDDANSRTLWGLGEVMSNIYLPNELRQNARTMFLEGLKNAKDFEYNRSKAMMIKALINAKDDDEIDKNDLDKIILKYANELINNLKKNSSENWCWFEDKLTYSNALLSESLMMAGFTLGRNEILEAGEKSLEFLINVSFMNNHYQPIGNSKWYLRGKHRSIYVQQPEDPATMVLALVSAYIITNKEMYRNLAMKCFSWFLGNNSRGIVMYNKDTGGCFDGLRKKSVNLNQGAESTVMYLLARLSLDRIYTTNNENDTDKRYISESSSRAV